MPASGRICIKTWYLMWSAGVFLQVAEDSGDVERGGAGAAKASVPGFWRVTQESPEEADVHAPHGQVHRALVEVRRGEGLAFFPRGHAPTLSRMPGQSPCPTPGGPHAWPPARRGGQATASSRCR